jgi:hypothetical protein
MDIDTLILVSQKRKKKKSIVSLEHEQRVVVGS